MSITTKAAELRENNTYILHTNQTFTIFLSYSRLIPGCGLQNLAQNCPGRTQAGEFPSPN
jgi:hypothetical protein